MSEAKRGASRMRWWLSPWRLLGLAVFGLLMTIAMAWGCALLTPATPLVTWTTGSPAKGPYLVTMRRGTGAKQHMIRRGQGIGTVSETLPSTAVVPGEPVLVSPKVHPEVWVGGVTTVEEVRTHVYGLPLPSMRWWSDFAPPSGMAMGPLWTPDQPIDRHGGWLIAEGTRTTDAKMLPLSVTVRPFVFNVLFWMLAGAACVEFGALVRRWRLRRAERLRGKCPHCGYDRAGLAAGVVCPECGKA